MKSSNVSGFRNIVSNLKSTPIVKKQTRIPQSQKMLKGIQIHHKRSPSNWKNLIKRQVNEIYNQILGKNLIEKHKREKSTKNLYQRFQEIMQTSQVAKKKHDRQTTGITDQKKSIWDSPKTSKTKYQEQLFQCEYKLIELIYRNNTLKQALKQLKKSIFEKVQTVKKSKNYNIMAFQ